MILLLLFSRAVFCFPILCAHNYFSPERVTTREMIIAWCGPACLLCRALRMPAASSVGRAAVAITPAHRRLLGLERSLSAWRLPDMCSPCAPPPKLPRAHGWPAVPGPRPAQVGWRDEGRGQRGPGVLLLRQRCRERLRARLQHAHLHDPDRGALLHARVWGGHQAPAGPHAGHRGCARLRTHRQICISCCQTLRLQTLHLHSTLVSTQAAS